MMLADLAVLAPVAGKGDGSGDAFPPELIEELMAKVKT